MTRRPRPRRRRRRRGMASLEALICGTVVFGLCAGAYTLGRTFAGDYLRNLTGAVGSPAF